MRTCTALLTAAVLLSSCGESGSPQQKASPGQDGPPGAATPLATSGGWALQSSGEGTALALGPADGTAIVRIFCPAGAKQLIVNVPSFTAIGSEERLSFGSGEEAHALVADPRGDAQRGGVSGIGPVPNNLAALISGPLSVGYGAQSSGPHPAPPQNVATEFASACAGQVGEPVTPRPSPATDPTPTGGSATPAAACLTHDGKAVPANRLRAVGTEPFWGARIEGRCVTYSHPEDQRGTRVWTRFSGTAANGIWTGTLGGKPFVLRTKPQASCSDGMSDNIYPIGVTLTVGGEQRTGCAAPL